MGGRYRKVVHLALTLLLLARPLCIDECGHLQDQGLQCLLHGHGADLQMLRIPFQGESSEFRHCEQLQTVFFCLGKL